MGWKRGGPRATGVVRGLVACGPPVSSRCSVHPVTPPPVSARFGVRRYLPLLAGILVTAGCEAWRAARDAPDSSTSAVALHPELLITGAIGDTGALADIRSVAADSAGRIYVLSRAPNEVRVFDPSGAQVARWGREGKGPGEFADPIGISIDRGGRVWVVDQGASRFSIFDPTGRLISTFPRLHSGSNVGRWRGVLTADGRVIDVIERPGPVHRTVLYRFSAGATAGADSSSLPAVKIPAFEHSRNGSWTRANIPFAPKQEWALDLAGQVWIGRSDAYVLTRRTFQGDSVCGARRQVAAVPVSAAERDAAISGLDWFIRLGGKVDASRIPRARPFFRGLAVDDRGRLWVQREHGDGASIARFDVFDSTGGYLVTAQGVLGELVAPPVIVRDRLYAIVADSDGVMAVVRAAVPAWVPARALRGGRIVATFSADARGVAPALASLFAGP